MPALAVVVIVVVVHPHGAHPYSIVCGRYDWWCMPQGNRTQVEKMDFDRMLPNINMCGHCLSLQNLAPP